ncbi:MAG TPA: PQQ-like beta-propeller repeat protein [Bacteroidales bacterium]|nr:PQQ-like beta-propeller repeat protein [Bacteroidales bacterium]
MKRLILAGGIFLLCLNFLYAQEASQWRGPSRNGIYPATGLLRTWPEAGPALLWHYDELGPGHASAAVTTDRIFAAGVKNGIGQIFCFTLDGKLLWQVPYGDEWMESWPGVRSTPLVLDGRIYLLSGMGKLVCLKASDGTSLWSNDLVKDLGGVNIKWGYTENLAFDGNHLFVTVGGGKNNVVALDRNTGKLIWSCPGLGEASAYGSPALIRLPGRTLLVTQTENHILGIDAGNGALLWNVGQTNTYSVHANTPLYHDGMLFVSSGYGRGGIMLQLSLDGSSVKELWRNASMDNRMGGFVLLNGRLYGSDDSGKGWYCLDWKTGRELGSEKITGKGTIISADGLLYCYSDKGEMVLAAPGDNGFTRLGGFKVPYGSDQHWAHPVIAGGRLYIRHGTSLMVYAISK